MATFTTTRGELQSSFDAVTSYLKKAKITPHKSGDLKRILEIAGDWLRLDPTSNVKLAWTTQELAWSLCVVSRLAYVIKNLTDFQIPFSNHLRGMAKGSARYGKRDEVNQHYFKDWELELFTAAALANSPMPIVLHSPGGTFDLSLGNDLEVECKHPSTAKKMAQEITSFGKRLAGKYGVLVFGMEDVLELWTEHRFSKREDFGVFVKQQFRSINSQHGPGWRKNLADYQRIVGLYFVVSAMIRYVDTDGKTKFTIQTLWTRTQEPILSSTPREIIKDVDVGFDSISEGQQFGHKVILI